MPVRLFAGKCGYTQEITTPFYSETGGGKSIKNARHGMHSSDGAQFRTGAYVPSPSKLPATQVFSDYPIKTTIMGISSNPQGWISEKKSHLQPPCWRARNKTPSEVDYTRCSSPGDATTVRRGCWLSKVPFVPRTPGIVPLEAGNSFVRSPLESIRFFYKKITQITTVQSQIFLES